MGKPECIVMGMMSGTSLDGVDIALCSFSKSKLEWKYDLQFAKTYSYNARWKKSLIYADKIASDELVKLDREYGSFLGRLVNETIREFGICPDLIASHGHTIFHNPKQGYSLQIGHGANIAGNTGVNVISDFRSADIALGGQGAPLVPVGDKLLYGGYQSCLNLGGFSNISFDSEEQRIAFDICPVNIVLNYISAKLGLDFDNEGSIGRKGKPVELLLQKLNALDYYNEEPPKSLGKEWLDKNFIPLLDADNSILEDKLSTIYKHIAFQIATVIRKYNLKNVFITGGGAHNSFLIQLLQENLQTRIIIPDKKTIDYKEAIVFAFLGLLRIQNEVNCYASVTGAQNNSICGTVYHGNKKKRVQRPTF